MAPDKWKHFFVGIPLGALLQVACLVAFPKHIWPDTAVSFLILFAGCYAFELYSLITGKGHYELADVWAGVIGGAIGIGRYYYLRCYKSLIEKVQGLIISLHFLLASSLHFNRFPPALFKIKIASQGNGCFRHGDSNKNT